MLGLLAALGFLFGASIIHPLSHAHDGHDHEGAGEIAPCATCIVGDEVQPDLDAKALLGLAAAPTGLAPETTLAAPNPAATLPSAPRAPPAC